MFDLDPFNRLVASGEMLLLLSLAALVGWLLARFLLSSRVGALQRTIAQKEAELSECRRAKAPLTRAPAGVSLPGGVRTTPVEPGVVSEPLSMPATGTPVLEVPVQLPPIVEPLLPPTMPGPPVASSEDEVLNRIAARANEINFDRIGRATAAQADDLKDIVGIGPFLERKLHAVGIYTFRQIGNFTHDDMTTVNDIIEFFPGRIERDDWVSQAQQAHERKYGNNASRP